MKILLDTNVVIDVLAHREPFFELSQMVLLAVEENVVEGYASASAITDIFYIVNKHMSSKTKARELFKEHLVSFVNVAAVNGDIITYALDIDWDDFEDAVQYSVGEGVEVDYIVTRNPDDFKKGTIAVISPKELVDTIAPE